MLYLHEGSMCMLDEEIAIEIASAAGLDKTPETLLVLKYTYIITTFVIQSVNYACIINSFCRANAVKIHGA